MMRLMLASSSRLGAHSSRRGAVPSGPLLQQFASWSATSAPSQRLPSASSPMLRLLARPGSTMGRRSMCTPKGQQEAAGSSVKSVDPPQDFAPMTVAQTAKTATRGTFWLGIAGLVVVCGGLIARELMPGRLSPNSVFTEAFDIVRDHHEVTARLGKPVKGYGTDHNGKREGRRNFVANDQFVDEDGVKHTRVKFNVEGPNGKGLIYAEVTAANTKNEMSYLIFDPQVRNQAPLALVDNRQVLTLEDKREKVVKALVAADAVLYGREDDQWTRQQRMEIGDMASQVKFVDITANPNDPDVQKLERIPSWKINGTIFPAFYKLDDLYRLAKQPPPEPAPQ